MRGVRPDLVCARQRRGATSNGIDCVDVGDAHDQGLAQSQLNLDNLILVFATVQFAWLVWYFYTGFGGPLELVARVLSIALILQILFMYQR